MTGFVVILLLLVMAVGNWSVVRHRYDDRKGS